MEVSLPGGRVMLIDDADAYLLHLGHVSVSGDGYATVYAGGVMNERFVIEGSEDGEGFRVVDGETGKATCWLANDAAYAEDEKGGQFTAEHIWRDYWSQVNAEAEG